MHRLFKRLHCALAGHPMSISHIEDIDGQLWATHESCDCGKKDRAQFPGAAVKMFHAAYQDFPPEWTEFY